MATSFLINGLHKLFSGLHHLPPSYLSKGVIPSSFIHTTLSLDKQLKPPKESTRWIENNDKIYPPQESGEPRRPAWVCYERLNIKYSPKKLWYVAGMIRGMSIDEAIKQLSFQNWKGSAIVKEILLEAQQEAVAKHNVEYKSNLWIDESFVGRSFYVKGLRRHARARFGKVEYKYCHYFVRLVEGSPPEHYYKPEATGNEKLKDYLDYWRRRRITLTL